MVMNALNHVAVFAQVGVKVHPNGRAAKFENPTQSVNPIVRHLKTHHTTLTHLNDKLDSFNKYWTDNMRTTVRYKWRGSGLNAKRRFSN